MTLCRVTGRFVARIVRRPARAPENVYERRAVEAWRNGTPCAAMRILLDAGYGYADRLAFLRNVVKAQDPEFWAESGNVDEGPATG